MKRILILLIPALLLLPAWAEKIKFNSKVEEFPLFNRDNSKIYTYVLVNPGDIIDFTINGADTLDIITRVLIDGTMRTEYEYSLQIGSENRRVLKSVGKSRETRGIGGEEVSTYNNLKIPLLSDSEKFRFTNISPVSILLKLNADIANTSNREIEYVRFTPDSYKAEKVLLIDDKSYTYYSTNSSLAITLEGPVVLKIISRLIFESNFENKKNYEFTVTDNGNLIASFSEEAFKSVKSIIKGEDDLIPSTGDVNIVKLGKGIHHIEINDGAANRDIIFRFYISKSAIELEKK